MTSTELQPMSETMPPPMADGQNQPPEQQIERFCTDFEILRREIGKVIVGHQPIVDGVLMALLVGGHVLLEGVPGLGKTMLVRTLADALRLKFQRIQFTPDLMPADLIGTNVLEETPEGRRHFVFQPGPVFANILLADEINRATPKTQSALLEAMQEQSVTIAGQTYQLPEPFLVLATQNPLEMEGTYPLPEAQLDRFLFKLLIRFPETSDLDAILCRTTEGRTPRAQPVLNDRRILEMGQLLRQVPAASEVRAYCIALVEATHPEHPKCPEKLRRFLRYGASPRGAQALILAAKALALLDRRYHVAREDIRAAAHVALRHRLILSFEGQAEGISPDAIIDRILETPVAKTEAWQETRSFAPPAPAAKGGGA
jgi:MoxR-like ATPase